MVAAVGTTTITALSRRIIRDVIVDNVYGSNVLFFRWNRMNKIIEKGGYQIEQPVMWTPMSGGGWYTGPQVLSVPQSDTIQNTVFAWKQAYGNVTVDGLTQLQADSPLKIADYLASQFKQTEMQLADLLGFGIWADGTNPQTIDGVVEALGNNSGTYGGIAQSTNPWWNSQLTTGATTQSLSVLNSKWIATQSGGQVPTVIVGDKNNYGRYWALNQTFQQFPQQPGGQDTQLAQAGFTNLVFNNVPWLQDDHAADQRAGLPQRELLGAHRQRQGELLCAGLRQAPEPGRYDVAGGLGRQRVVLQPGPPGIFLQHERLIGPERTTDDGSLQVHQRPRALPGGESRRRD